MTTALIPVIEHDERCSWCDIPLAANGLPPIRTHNKVFHTTCIGAYAMQYWVSDIRKRRIFRG